MKPYLWKYEWILQVIKNNLLQKFADISTRKVSQDWLVLVFGISQWNVKTAGCKCFCYSRARNNSDVWRHLHKVRRIRSLLLHLAGKAWLASRWSRVCWAGSKTTNHRWPVRQPIDSWFEGWSQKRLLNIFTVYGIQYSWVRHVLALQKTTTANTLRAMLDWYSINFLDVQPKILGHILIGFL